MPWVAPTMITTLAVALGSAAAAGDADANEPSDRDQGEREGGDRGCAMGTPRGGRLDVLKPRVDAAPRTNRGMVPP